ncbi:MAG: response regulator [Deltaproteobacteria bacterium]|nr:response regulator [Deltaproteobacteria bacterium]
MDVRILVVDDDKDTCEYMKDLLALEGFKVETLSEPEQTVPKLREGKHQMVLLDLMMPGTSGLQVLEQIREYDKNIATMILTGYPTLETAVDAMKLEACDYIKKPFEVDEFRRAIRAALEKHGVLLSPEEDLHRSIGRIIRQLREEQGLKLRHLASRTGLSVSLLSQIERAESSASVSSLFKIAIALNHKMSEFFGDF